MKGKKIDTQFVSAFISDCIGMRILSQDQILEQAKAEIQCIDEEIRRMEAQKKHRAKLLDVVATLEKPVKTDKTNEIKILSFFKIQNPHICKHICEKVKTRLVKIDDLKTKLFVLEDIVFCVKQLIEHRVLCKIDDIVAPGDMFDDYIKFVLKDK